METAVLIERFRQRDIVVGVVGLGYVGLPLCIAVAGAAMRVIGFDVDASKPVTLAAGGSYLSSVPAAATAPLMASGIMQATTD
ncbi:MAG TPA: nucleotide sugar dehydrogenase, partial [Polymorphobacter sp.]|nr:nucleotide sugar dehydrogenase [Polymorphobacter sp.]